VRTILIERLGARAYVLGFDSKFGRDKRGTPEFLAKRGYDVRVVEQVQVGGRAVSSTAIREAVELGDLDGARRMLGRRVGVMGSVVRGDALGREIGFPTANLNLHHELHPPPGVYAGWATLVGDDVRAGESERIQVAADPPQAHPAVANIGVRPTIDQNRPNRPRLEVHLLDFADDLYGLNLEFSFAERLRGEVRFPSLEALKTQIARDVARARELLPRLDP
jgi:riboflavin kinase/FMN adenylyltransferase